MIYFSRPCDHDRLNATVYSVISMHFDGAVCIQGSWDAYETLDYLERRMRRRMIGTLNESGTLFSVRGKYVYFDSDCVLITTCKSDLLSD